MIRSCRVNFEDLVLGWNTNDGSKAVFEVVKRMEEGRRRSAETRVEGE